MDHPDALGIVGGVEITGDSFGIWPGDRFGVRVHNLKAEPCLCQLRAFVELGSPLWEASFRMEAFEESTLTEIPGSDAALTFPASPPGDCFRIHAEFEPVADEAQASRESEMVVESVALWNLAAGDGSASLEEQLRQAMDFAEVTIWNEYIGALRGNEHAQGIAWHVWHGSSPEKVASDMNWMVNDSVEEATECLDWFRTNELGALQERVALAAARVENYLKNRIAVA